MEGFVLQLLIPYCVRVLQVVPGQPGFLEAPVLKMALRKFSLQELLPDESTVVLEPVAFAGAA